MRSSTISLLLALASSLAASVHSANWPCWRGPSHQGESPERNLPLRWSADSNVLWQAAIPGEAWSSPVVWGNRVYLTTTTEGGANGHVLCMDARTGALIWNKKVLEQVPLKKERRNSYATPTPVADGERVFAVFGDGSIAALSLDGEVAWLNREVKFYSQHGLGASPILYEDLLIMPFDGSSTGENKRIGWQIPWDQSFLLAVETKTGAERWRSSRGQSRIAHVSPNILTQDGKDFLISGAGDVVQGYALPSGRRLWSVYSQGEGVTPSIVIGDGVVFSASGFEKPHVRAIRPPREEGGEPEIIWEQNKGVPMIPSFVSHEKHLFGITDGGIATCFNAADGSIVWQERIGGNHSASPVLAEGRIYFLSEAGETTVIKAAPEFEILARNPLEGTVQASMAVANGRFYIRTDRKLFCIATE